MTKQKTAFVVTRTNFEYNDEVHTVGESEGGTPVAVFLTNEEAREELKQRTVDFLKDWKDLCGFGYGADEIYSRKPKFLDIDEEKFFQTDTYEIDQLLDVKNRSQEDLEELASCLSFMPCFITEVPLGSPV